MAEQESTFASEQVELSELERITQRLNDFTVGLKPQSAEQVNQIMQKGLSAGNFKLDELDALVSIREQVNAGIIDYNTQVQVASKRIQELEIEEAQRQKDLIAKNLADKDQEITNQRVAKKEALKNLKLAEEENKILKAKLEALSSVENNVTSKPIQDLLDESKAAAEQIVNKDEPKVKSKAWEMIRAGRPPTSPANGGWDTPTISEDEELKDKIDETKKAFKDFEAESNEFKPQGTTTASFYDEVERVNEVAEADELFKQEDELEPEDLQVGFDDESFEEDEDADFVDDEDFYNGVAATEDTVIPQSETTFDVTKDDEETKPNFTKPVITGGNAPNITAQVSEPENIVAPVEEEKQSIPTYESEEELLASAQAKIDEAQEEESDYEEITIPSRSELENLSKAEVVEEADKLGFELSGTKEEMIDQFEEQVEAFIAQLQEDGDFIDATETDSEEKKDGDDDVRDGGYF